MQHRSCPDSASGAKVRCIFFARHSIALCYGKAMGTEIKIRKIVSVPLLGESPKGGWSSEIRPEDSIHTLIAVHTDAGITGYGSAFTNGGLVASALKVLEPLFAGRNALEPERTTELLHQNTFWMGRGGTLTHAISGIDIALWDILGKAVGQ